MARKRNRRQGRDATGRTPRGLPAAQQQAERHWDRHPARMPAAICSFVLAVAGLVVSGYLSFEHYTGSATLACSDTGVVNCLKVTTSQWSVILGLPVAVAGLAFFAGMVLFCLPVRAVANWHVLRIACCVVGIGMVLWLVYVELFKVDAICLWCTSVHGITLLLLLCVIWWRESARNSGD